jgi:hypothetical protein
MPSFIQFSNRNHLEITLDAQKNQEAVLKNAARTLYNSRHTRFTLKDTQGQIVYACDRSSTKNLHTILAKTRSSRDNYIEYITGPFDRKDDNSDIALILAQNARKRDLSILKSLAPKRSLFKGAFKSMYGFISKTTSYLFFPLRLVSYLLDAVSKCMDQPFLLLSNTTTRGVFYRIFTETPVEESNEGSRNIQLEQYHAYHDSLRDFEDDGLRNPGESLALSPSEANYPKEMVMRLGDATAVVKRQYSYTWSTYNPIGYLNYLAQVLLSGIADFCTAVVSVVLSIPLWCVRLLLVVPQWCSKDPLVAQIALLNSKINEALPKIEIFQNCRGLQIFQEAALPKEKVDGSRLTRPLLSQRNTYDPSLWSVNKLREKQHFDPEVLKHIASFV